MGNKLFAILEYPISAFAGAAARVESLPPSLRFGYVLVYVSTFLSSPQFLSTPTVNLEHLPQQLRFPQRVCGAARWAGSGSVNASHP